MKSVKLGKNISVVEVQQISPQGIWLYACEKEYFLPYQDYPWFKEAKVSDIYNVEILNGGHLHWPTLDVDLELEALEEPEKYPLIYK